MRIASIPVAVSGSIVPFLLLAGLARMALRYLLRLCVVVVRALRPRLRAVRRMAWHRLTLGRWMPSYRWEPMDGKVPLGIWEKCAFRVIATSVRSKGEYADEPDYTRRPQ